MSDADRKRWESIVDHEMLGETTSDEDAAFRAAYEAAHPECARELEQWSAMVDHLATRPDLGPSNRDLTDRVLERRRDGDPGLPAEPIARPRRGRLYGGAAAVAAAAAVIVTIGASSLGTDPDPVQRAQVEPPPAVPSEAAAPAETLAPAPKVVLASSGALRVDGQPAGVGTALAGGQRLETVGAPACLRHEQPFGTVCLAPHSVARVHTWTTDHRELQLERGRALSILDTLPRGQRFSISTSAGSVTAVGTVFTVEVAEDGTASAQVLEGTVELSTPGGTAALHAREQAILGQAPTRFDPVTAAIDVPVRAASLWREGPASVLDLSTAPAGADLSLDGIDLGQTPLTAALPPGSYALEISSHGRETVVDEIVLRSGDTLSRGYSLEATAKRTPKAKPVPLAELLRRARESLAAGRWRETERIYRQIIGDHPDAPAALVTQVQLGDLLLDDLGDPRGALRAYDAYLRRGGDVALEAGFGRIRALRRLGRTADELAAIEAFLASHPRAIHAPDLRARANELRGR